MPRSWAICMTFTLEVDFLVNGYFFDDFVIREHVGAG